MVMTDPIADFLTRIRNANMVMHEKVEIPASKTKIALAEILKNEGFIKDYEQVEDGKQGIIRVYLLRTFMDVFATGLPPNQLTCEWHAQKFQKCSTFFI